MHGPRMCMGDMREEEKSSAGNGSGVAHTNCDNELGAPETDSHLRASLACSKWMRRCMKMAWQRISP